MIYLLSPHVTGTSKHFVAKTSACIAKQTQCRNASKVIDHKHKASVNTKIACVIKINIIARERKKNHAEKLVGGGAEGEGNEEEAVWLRHCAIPISS